MRVPFAKMEGCGNDYVFVDGIGTPLPLERGPELARRWSDRHFGIGADGLIVLQRGTSAPLRMSMWNADGSRGAMCGNGLRCLARFASQLGYVSEVRFAVDTDAGRREVELLGDEFVRIMMGEVTVLPPCRIIVAGVEVELMRGDAGNPHAVILVDQVDRIDVPGIGSALQSHTEFPTGVNVEFVQVLDRRRLRQRTFERGSGETLACGTGATVAAVAARAMGRVDDDPVAVELRGGTLCVEGHGSSLALVGPTRTVFRGEIELPA